VDIKPELLRRATNGQLIQHPVRGALQPIRFPHGGDRFGKVGKRGLPDREGDDGVRPCQFGHDARQGVEGSGLNRPPHLRDERIGLVLSHGCRVVFVRLRRQARIDQRHAPPRDDGRLPGQALQRTTRCAQPVCSATLTTHGAPFISSTFFALRPRTR
jgi:hypothetical protein